MVGPALFAPESWLGRDGSVKRRGAPLRARKGARHYRFGNRRKDLSATSRRNLLFVASQNGEVGMILLRKILKPAIGAVGGACAIALIGLGPGIRPRAILRELQRRRRRQGDGCGGRRDPRSRRESGRGQAGCLSQRLVLSSSRCPTTRRSSSCPTAPPVRAASRSR